MGADTKANTLELVRVPSSLLQRFQRGVALEALRESGSSFRAEAVARETASMGAGSGAEGYQWALTEGEHLGAAAHSSEVRPHSGRLAARAMTLERSIIFMSPSLSGAWLTVILRPS